MLARIAFLTLKLMVFAWLLSGLWRGALDEPPR
jgi:hypothetical protein